MKTQFLSFIVVVFVILANGCSLLSGSDSCDFAEAGIIFRDGRCGSSIEGIRIGDDSTFVVQTLGKPDAIGIGNSWILAYHIDGVHAIGVSITEDTALVTSIRVSRTYPGKTQNGIGIGANRAAVLLAHGEPGDSYQHSPLIHTDVYSFLKSAFWMEYHADTLFSITMGS